MKPDENKVPTQSVLGVQMPEKAQDEFRPYVEERYEVLDDCDIPASASTFHLRRGQIITSAGWDVGQIRRAGAKLKKLDSLTIDPPGTP